MPHVNLNGSILPVEQVLFGTNNRAFRYGDSLFETFRIFDGRMPFLPLHYNRLLKGIRLLGYEIPIGFNADFIAAETHRLVGDSGNYRVRLMLFRGGGGLYSPTSNHFEYLIEASPLSEAQFQFPEKGMQVGIIAERLLYPSPLAALKTGNTLPYILAARKRQTQGWDDALLLNHQGQVVEGLSSNIFVVKDDELLLPKSDSGQVAGITQQIVCERLGISAREADILPQDLLNAEGILFCNSIQGIRWVAECEGIEYQRPSWGAKITRGINELIR